MRVGIMRVGIMLFQALFCCAPAIWVLNDEARSFHVSSTRLFSIFASCSRVVTGDSLSPAWNAVHYSSPLRAGCEGWGSCFFSFLGDSVGASLGHSPPKFDQIETPSFVQTSLHTIITIKTFLTFQRATGARIKVERASRSCGESRSRRYWQQSVCWKDIVCRPGLGPLTACRTEILPKRITADTKRSHQSWPSEVRDKFLELPEVWTASF